jgi:hypothetical protein
MAYSSTDMQASQASREDQHRLDSKISVVPESAGLISDSNSLEVIYKRICRRVLLLFVIAVILNHIDRTNLAYAAITFNRCGWLAVFTACCGFTAGAAPACHLVMTRPVLAPPCHKPHIADVSTMHVLHLLLSCRDLGFGPQTYGESTCCAAAPTEFAAPVTCHTASIARLSLQLLKQQYELSDSRIAA